MKLQQTAEMKCGQLVRQRWIFGGLYGASYINIDQKMTKGNIAHFTMDVTPALTINVER